MTQVRIPPLAGGQARIRLVYWTNQSLQVIGFEGPEWATAYENLDLTAEAVVELTPTADIATNDGSATGYLITATTTGQRGWSCCVQVPDSPTEVELADLVGAAAIDPDNILASRLLPTGATDGQFAVYDADAEAWLATTVAPGAGLGAGDDAALLGSATATDGQVLTADGLGGAAWEAAADGTGATNLSIANAGVSTIDIASDTGTDATIPAATAAAAGLATAAQITKLDGIAAGATAAGATGDAFASSHPGGNQHIDWTADQGATNIHSGNIPALAYDPAGSAAAVSVASIGAAAASHAHGNITSAGAIGSTASLPIITTTSGVLTAGAFGTGATNFCAGNDARLSDARTPAAHNQAETTITFTDVATGNASTTAHGFSPKATAPAAGLVNVLAIANGETAHADKALFDTTNPAALGSVGPGSAVIAARRDHVHAMPSAANVGAAAATSFIAGAGALTGPAAPLTIGTAAGAATGDFAATSHNQAETTITFTDVATGDASTAAHGFAPKATAPASGLLSVLAIGNGETVYTNKALFDTTNPAALGTAAPGTSLIAARQDHVHEAPAGSAADIGQYDIAARLASGTGAYTGVAAGDLTEEGTPAAGMFVPGWLSTGELRKFDVGDLPGGGGGVDTANTPNANEFARFTDADTIEGRTAAEALGDLGAQRALTGVSASITSANLTATVNAHHVLTISGMTAERSFVIPAGTAEGDLISWECITAAPATAGYELVLIGDTGITLVLGGTDRTATADGAYRYLLAGETGLLRWDATASKWRLIRDGRLPTNVRIQGDGTNTQDTGEAADTLTLHGNMPTTAYNNGFIVIEGDRTTPTASSAAARRAGSYMATFAWSSKDAAADGDRVQVSLHVNSTSDTRYSPSLRMGAAATAALAMAGPIALAAGDVVFMRFRSTVGGVGTSQYSFANFITLQEQM